MNFYFSSYCFSWIYLEYVLNDQKYNSESPTKYRLLDVQPIYRNIFNLIKDTNNMSATELAHLLKFPFEKQLEAETNQKIINIKAKPKESKQASTSSCFKYCNSFYLFILYLSIDSNFCI